jgi:hypothetical protein
MIERFRLPDAPFAVKQFIDLVRRSTFDGIHDLCQRMDFHRFEVDCGSKDQMHVVRHDNSSFQVELRTVIVQTTFKNDMSNPLRQNPTFVSAESYEVGLVVALQMRKLPPIKCLRHREPVGTAAPAVRRSEAPLLLMLTERSVGVNVRMRSTANSDSNSGMAQAKIEASFARPDSRGRLSLHDFSSRDGSQQFSTSSPLSASTSVALPKRVFEMLFEA